MHFSFFNRKKSLVDASVFGGMTDWHCHILPGVDDGIASMQESLEALAYYEQLGIKEVWLTPHILEDIPNTPQFLRERFDELKQTYSGGIRLNLAAENMLDKLFLERLNANDILPLGQDASHILVELSYVQPPTDLFGSIRKIRDKGYCPILAHPERYTFMDEEDYMNLKRIGCKLQMNLLSLTGMYGSTALRKSQSMLTEGFYDICGSDLHSLKHFQHGIHKASFSKEYLSRLTSLTRQSF